MIYKHKQNHQSQKFPTVNIRGLLGVVAAVRLRHAVFLRLPVSSVPDNRQQLHRAANRRLQTEQLVQEALRPADRRHKGVGGN